MSDSSLPAPNRLESSFTPPNSPRGSTESICPSGPNTPLPELANDSSFRLLHPTRQPSPMPNLVAINEQHLGPTWDTIPRAPGPIHPDMFVRLSTKPINQDSIEVTFPNDTSQDRGCPFRLLDCGYFLSTGEVALWEFNNCRSLQAEVATPRFEEIKTWMDSQCISWVAVSYDKSDGSPPVDSEGPDVHIRPDVLRELCKVAINRFKVKFLWLDKLCVFQNSTMEVCRWRMPAHVKWAFGLAKGTFFLPNGLNRMLPMLQAGGKYPVPDRASDLAVSFRCFLELAFNDNLGEVIVPLAYASRPEEGHPSASTDIAETSTPDNQVFHVLLKNILEDTISDGVPEVGDDPPVAGTIPTEPNELVPQTQPNHHPDILAHHIYDRESLHRLRIKALLTVLSCQDYLKSYYHCATDEQPTGTDRIIHNLSRNPMLAIADWEEAIWSTVLFYRNLADSPAQMVFGLAWLLQDLCDVQHPARKSALDLVSAVMNGVMGAEGLNPVTGETEPHFPMVPVGLSFVVNRFNEISVPCGKLVAKLSMEGSWNISFPREWILHTGPTDTTGRGTVPQRATPRYPESPGADSIHPEIGDLQLELTVAFDHSQDERPALALGMTRLSHANMLLPPTAESRSDSRTRKQEIVHFHFIPIDIQTAEGPGGRHAEVWNVKCLEVQRCQRATNQHPHWDWEYWQMTERYVSLQVKVESPRRVEPPPEQCTRITYQITPHGAVKE